MHLDEIKKKGNVLARRRGKHRNPPLLDCFSVSDTSSIDSLATISPDSGLLIETNITTLTIGNTQYSVLPEHLEWLSHLGSGQFGRVDAYRHKPSLTDIAIKILPAWNPSNDHWSEHLREVRFGMTFDHCNVVSTYGYLCHEGELWFLMEKLDTNLDKLYRCVFYNHHGCFPESILLYFVFCIARGLQYLYNTFKVMHRDVKPSNVLASAMGDIKLCDFGISGILSNSITSTNVGAEMYLAPERITDSNIAYGIKADVWSLGISVLEMAIGRFPIDNWDCMYTRAMQVHRLVPPTLPSGSPYSEAVRMIVDSCLVLNVNNRFNYQQILCLEAMVKVSDELVERRCNAGAYIQTYL